jgi:hypothetical protein
MEQETAKSAVTIKSPAPSTFKGRVTSPNDACVKGRGVKLLQPVPGGPPKSISAGVTDKNGVWRVGLEGTLSGDYFAKATAKHVGSLLCKAARSPTIGV